jgi:hypothetical protein
MSRNKINVRSPYFITSDLSTNDSARFDVYIFNGLDSARPTDPTYSIVSTNIDETNIVSVNISELIKDFTELNFSGTYSQDTYYVDCVINLITDGSTTSSSEQLFRAFRGYGYFEEGSNPQLDNKILMSNDSIVKYQDDTLYVPVDADLVSDVVFLRSDGTNINVTIPTPTTSSEEVAYAKDTLQLVDYINRVSNDDGIYEESVCLEVLFDEVNETTTDRVFVIGNDGSVDVVGVRNVDECTYSPYKLTFINKFGVLQDLWFFKTSKLNMNTKEESFRSNTLSSGSYSVSDHQYKVLYKTAKKSLQLNSGFYNEDYNETFTQLFLSEKVWIEYNNQTLPVNISSKNLEYKTRLNDMLIQYRVQLDFAFDTINSIR